MKEKMSQVKLETSSITIELMSITIAISNHHGGLQMYG